LLGQLSAGQRRATARLAAAFSRQDASLYLVGGAVRDLLLGRAVPDLDFTTAAPPTAIRAAASAAGATAIYSANERFATVGLELEGEQIEITTFRGEPGGGLHADLAGRDFTCNAMAVVVAGASDEEPGTLLDPFDGQAICCAGRFAACRSRGRGSPTIRCARCGPSASPPISTPSSSRKRARRSSRVVLGSPGSAASGSARN
jgi:poly(A) polymerase